MPDPQRGEVWLVDLGMAAKVRPALVFSIPVTVADRALVTLVPHTTAVRGSQFEVACEARFLRAGVFNVQSLVTVPQPKLFRKLGALSLDELRAVETAVRTWLGLQGASA